MFFGPSASWRCRTGATFCANSVPARAVPKTAMNLIAEKMSEGAILFVIQVLYNGRGHPRALWITLHPQPSAGGLLPPPRQVLEQYFQGKPELPFTTRTGNLRIAVQSPNGPVRISSGRRCRRPWLPKLRSIRHSKSLRAKLHREAFR